MWYTGPMSRPFVRVVGVTLGLSACAEKPPVVQTSPPATIPEATPEPPPTPLPPTNPPVPTLPSWDDVASGHPQGATNPPTPILVVSKSPEACFKAFIGGMIAPGPEVASTGGRVVETPADAGGTQIRCPEGQPAQLLAAHEAWLAGFKKVPI